MKTKLFINLSNHPFDKWDDKQQTAARQFGEIRDMPFPAIPADATSSEVEAMARNKEKEILALAKDFDITIHIMGELSFSFDLVNMLKADGIHCIVSTSDRIVKDLGNGKKVVQFNFVKFRDY